MHQSLNDIQKPLPNGYKAKDLKEYRNSKHGTSD